MRSLILSLFFILQTLTFFGQVSHKDARIGFQKIVDDEKACQQFIKNLKNAPDDDCILKAYRGAANIVMAKFVSMPNKKLSYFLDGKADLDLCVEKMPLNVEIRYLRFRIQENTPSMLLYDNQEEDLPIIIDKINDVKDPVYRQKIKAFILESGKCSDEQALRLKNS